MKLTEYGPGDPQTWGGLDPDGDHEWDDFNEKVHEELSDKLYEALESVGMEALHMKIIEGIDFITLANTEALRRKKEEEAERAIARHEARMEAWD